MYQLKHMVAEHHLARRGSQILAHIERPLIRKGYHQVTIIGLNITHKIFKPSNQAFTVGLYGARQGLWIGAQKIARAEHIHDLTAEEIQLLPLASV